MIDHLPVEQLKLKDEVTFWRLVQWVSAPVALGVASAVAMTAQPFIAASMHMPAVGAWSVAVSIPLVSGFVTHLAVEGAGLKRAVLSACAISCIALSAYSILSSKDFALETEYKSAATAQQASEATTSGATAEAKLLILKMQQQAQATYTNAVAKCAGKRATDCKTAAQKALDKSLSQLGAQYSDQASVAAPLAVVTKAELKPIDYVLAAVPDAFAGILSFMFFLGRSKAMAFRSKIRAAAQPVAQKKAERPALADVKLALNDALSCGEIPPVVMALDGQIVVNRLAKHFGVHHSTAKAMLTKADKHFVNRGGKFYLKTSAPVLKLVGVSK